MRYGHAISEQGMGGNTTDSSGSANQGMLQCVRLVDLLARNNS